MRIVIELDVAEIGAALHPRRRMVILQREDGFYAFAEQYYYVSQYDGEIIAEGWATLPADGIYANCQMAEIQGRAAFSHRHEVTY
ncbi:hypothetical protein G6M04_30335 [Agrobacterium rhizogenes]|uniref:hypothetical protein n=1 Tax=Rhizobium rhizogenes TaxID=359 RepID=UPI00157177EF|nr:hypothetical protein [Rhizobium rhizogenes]NTG51697.1 hypothetical protein [Rhizobium rhizogenes]